MARKQEKEKKRAFLGRCRPRSIAFSEQNLPFRHGLNVWFFIWLAGPHFHALRRISIGSYLGPPLNATVQKKLNEISEDSSGYKFRYRNSKSRQVFYLNLFQSLSVLIFIWNKHVCCRPFDSDIWVVPTPVSRAPQGLWRGERARYGTGSVKHIPGGVICEIHSRTLIFPVFWLAERFTLRTHEEIISHDRQRQRLAQGDGKERSEWQRTKDTKLKTHLCELRALQITFRVNPGMIQKLFVLRQQNTVLAHGRCGNYGIRQL